MKRSLNLDESVKRHNRRAIAQWVWLSIFALALFLGLTQWGPRLAYKLMYEKQVRQTVMEVLMEVNEREIDHLRTEVQTNLNQLEILYAEPGTQVHRAHAAQGPAGEGQDGSQ